MSNNIKIGLIARADESGLGRLSQDFYKYLPIDKVLVVHNRSYAYTPDIYKNKIVCELGTPSLKEIDEFLKDIDVVLTFETPYNWTLFSEAKKRGIKTILIPNYEWLPANLPVVPDLFICPSKLDYDEVVDNSSFGSQENAIYLPIPIDEEKIQFRLRKKAKTFVFNNGHGGYLSRNGAKELFEAISLVRKDIQFLIHSQVYFPQIINDSRITIQYGDLPYNELFKDGDVFIFPHKFDGLSLPIQEALMAGMPVITTDIYPHNTYLPKEWLFEPEAITRTFIKREIDMAILNPVKIAQKIEEWADKDIEEQSQKAKEISKQWSWQNLKPKYLQVISKLCHK